MATNQPPDPGDSLETLLQQAEPPVRYDVERGFARHQRLLASGANLPEWAAEVPARTGTSLLRKWAPWLGAGFMVGALVFWRVERASVPEGVVVGSASGASERVDEGSPESAARSSSRRARGNAHDSLTSPAPATALPAPGAPTVMPEPAGRLTLVPTVEELAPRDDTVGSPSTAVPSTTTRGVAPTQDGPVNRSERATAPSSVPARAASGQSTQAASGSASAPASARANGQAPMDREEVMQLAQAEQLLLTDPGAAITLVRKGNVQFKRGYLKHERRYIEVMALFAAGQTKEGQSRAQFFLRDYPTSPYREKVRTAAEANAAP